MASIATVNNQQKMDSKVDSDSETSTGKTELSEPVRKLFESVNAGNLEEVKTLLAQGVSVDSMDDHGMTPLQHAAYKGFEELCEFFVNHGADVNANAHDHGYTALMFAALTGNKNIIRLLLERGAKSYMENSVHRTAAQMAAFVGQHEVVSLINNFFAREVLEYYCTPRGLETEPKLPPELASPLYKYIMIVNLNPVKLSLYLQNAPELLLNSDKVTKVLDLLCEKMMKQHNTDEIMAIKFHYLSYVIKSAVKMTKEKGNNLEFWFKYLLKGRDSDGFPDNQESLIRSMLKEFPYVECQLFQQIVRTITSTQILDRPSAFSVLTSCINGQRFASADDKCCSACGDLNSKTCAICRSVYYCSRECQKMHWFVHKKFCKALAEKRQVEERNKPAEETQKGEEDGTDRAMNVPSSDAHVSSDGIHKGDETQTHEESVKELDASMKSDLKIGENA